jgi:hypothetical protein
MDNSCESIKISLVHNDCGCSCEHEFCQNITQRITNNLNSDNTITAEILQLYVLNLSTSYYKCTKTQHAIYVMSRIINDEPQITLTKSTVVD